MIWIQLMGLVAVLVIAVIAIGYWFVDDDKR